MTPESLKHQISSGLLSFPVTHFKADLAFDKQAYQDHISWLAQYKAAALFAAGGTGEFFSLTPSEVPEVTAAAKEVAGDTAIISGCGFGTKLAIEIAQSVVQKKADGLLLLPHYLTNAPQEGIFQHIKAICHSIPLGVILYNRANSIASAETIERLCDVCPNLIGFKDGTGELSLVRDITSRCGDRLAYIGGMPTHETYAEAYDAMGVTTYSSAVFNFVPEMAQTFYQAVQGRDKAVINQLLQDFFYPLLKIRDKSPGYAVSIIKAGLTAVGRRGGPVRPPLSNLSEDEIQEIKALIQE